VGVLGVFVGLVGLALGTGTAELAPLAAAVGLPVVVAPVAASLRARRVRVRLAVDAAVSPALAVVGGEVTLRIGVTNRSAGPAPALAVEAPGRRWRRQGGEVAGAEAAAPGWLVPAGLITLPAPGARGRSVFAGAVPSGRRGVFVLPARASWVLDPFGLFGARGPVVPAVSAVLFPAARADVVWPGSVGDRASAGATAAAPGPGRDGPGELVGIRPYVAGDRLSLVHWPARARYGAWYVRQFGPDEGERTRLVLDDRAGVHRQKDFEEMLAEAHGLVELCWQDGRTVELCTLSGRSVTLAPVAAGVEEGRVLLAAVLPRATGADAPVGAGTVITTATGAQSLPAGTERIVVGG
jgi:uncharacterized protein (DUF58 family)